MNKIQRLVLMAAWIPMLAICSCQSTSAYRQSDGSLMVRSSGGNSLPSESLIKGAARGKITPASRLSLSVKSKHRAVRVEKLEGFVDWMNPQRVEIRLIRVFGEKAIQLRYVNGEHFVRQLYTAPVEHRNLVDSF